MYKECKIDGDIRVECKYVTRGGVKFLYNEEMKKFCQDEQGNVIKKKRK